MTKGEKIYELEKQDIDEDKFYLGKLCKRGHNYKDAGKSLRYKNGNCVECNKKFRQSEKGKVSQKRARQSEKGKRIHKKYDQSDKGRAAAKRHSQTKKGKETRKKYNQSDKRKAAAKRHGQTEKGKASAKKARQSDKGKAWRHRQSAEHTSYAIGRDISCLVWHALNRYTETGKTKSCKKYGIYISAIAEHLGPHPNTLGISGEYHIHHIVPLRFFNFNDSEHIKVAFDPLNHTWLLAEDNLSKEYRELPKRCDVPEVLLKKLDCIGLKI